jgi:DNA-binding transcriptional regulator YdaS (Cro superfamily)
MFGGMTLAEFRKHARLSQAKFAARLVAAGYPATQALISQWEAGTIVITAERCVQIEQVTSGAVTRKELRADLFGDLPTQNDAARINVAA